MFQDLVYNEVRTHLLFLLVTAAPFKNSSFKFLQRVERSRHYW
jgi:hypothetical protein